MGKIVCSCQKEFDSKFEHELHLNHNRNHFPVPLPIDFASESNVKEETPLASSMPEPEIIEEAPYNLAASREGLGELSPVLKDIDGNVIDGFHRLGENANWHSITVSTIDNPVKLELARLAVNYNRRKVSPEELSQRITFLVKSGLKPDEIAKFTGISKATVYRYTPQELKNAQKVEAGKLSASARMCEHTVTIPDSASDVPRVRTFAEAAEEVAAETVKAAESSFAPGALQVESKSTVEDEEDSIPEGCPICPCCSASLNLSEYEEIKQKIKVKFGKSIQILLFPESEEA